MQQYRRLDFDKLNFSENVISYDEAVKRHSPCDFSNDVLSGQKKINLCNPRKEYGNKCVKLEIY